MRELLFTLAAAATLAASPATWAAFNAPPPTRKQIEADWLRQDAKRLQPLATNTKVTREADAAGAVDGVKDGKWGFHTENEQNPWWQVDLGSSVNVERVVIYNRCDGGFAARNSRIIVRLSENGSEFRQAYQHDGTVFHGFTDQKPLVVDLKGGTARFLRLALNGTSYFHLDEVEVYAAGGTENIALGKPATQSSTSQWSASHGRPGVAQPREYPMALAVQRGLKLAASLRRLAETGSPRDHFPLTPALSPEERENHPQRLDKSDTSGSIQQLATGLPLPEGEGRGEGEGIMPLANAALLARITANESLLNEVAGQLKQLPTEASDDVRRALYFRAHWAARELALANPLLNFDSILFVKRAPTLFPHMSDQHYGWWSRGGGGIYVLRNFKQVGGPTSARLTNPESSPAESSPLTPALSPLRGEGDAQGVAGESPASARAVTSADPARSLTLPRTASDLLSAAEPPPSPLNGERAGVRGEAVQTSARSPGSAIHGPDSGTRGTRPSDRSAPEVVCLTADMPLGNFIGPDISYDGRKVLFAYAKFYPELQKEKNKAAKANVPEDAFYHVFEMNVDGTGRRQITRGRYDDFEARYLPNGDILFLSTRKGHALQASAAFSESTREADLPDSYVRCGGDNWRPVPVFTMHAMNAEGRNLRPLSAFENFEWAPSVASDGRLLYTRWDYIDRFNGHFFSLWSANQDGTNPQLVYGNYTVKPQVVLEARSIPGSSKLVFTACAHHSITGGSLCLLDRTRGIEEQEPLTRLTPEVCFPETEGWPEHYYAHPWPLSEEYFLVGWADAKLPPHRFVEDHHNPTNAMGIYLYDAFGNLELLYRDPHISSMTPLPVAPRVKPPTQAPLAEWNGKQEGRFLVQDIYRGLDGVRRGSVKQLRIVGMPPKVQPHQNQPMLGVSNEDPGKFVLGTVPVEADGSAHFRVPSGVPVFFQALAEQGLAVQTMRSLSYVMPGQTLSCVGCHEHRDEAPTAGKPALAARREPSKLTPGPSGSWPLRFDQLVQPVLDRHCVSCHRPGSEDVEAAQLDLTSTNAWKALMTFGGEDLKKRAFERDRSYVGQGTAAHSKLWQLLADPAGHREVKLEAESLARFATWMDTYAHRIGHYSAEQESKLAAFRAALEETLLERPSSP